MSLYGVTEPKKIQRNMNHLIITNQKSLNTCLPSTINLNGHNKDLTTYWNCSLYYSNKYLVICSGAFIALHKMHVIYNHREWFIIMISSHWMDSTSYADNSIVYVNLASTLLVDTLALYVTRSLAVMILMRLSGFCPASGWISISSISPVRGIIQIAKYVFKAIWHSKG